MKQVYRDQLATLTDLEAFKTSLLVAIRQILTGNKGQTATKCSTWHPVDTVELFNIGKCFENPHLLDKADLSPDFGTEINSASFIDDSRILIHSSKEEPFQENPILPAGHIAIWHFVTDELSRPVAVDAELGNLFAIDDKRAWDMYKFPKIVNTETGKIEWSIKGINSGIQNSSIIGDNIDSAPQIRFNKRNGKILIMVDNETIEVLSP